MTPGNEIFGIEGLKCCFSGMGGFERLDGGDEGVGDGVVGLEIGGVSGNEKLISGRDVAGVEVVEGEILVSGAAALGIEGLGVGSGTGAGCKGSDGGTSRSRGVSFDFPPKSLVTESNVGISKSLICSN